MFTGLDHLRRRRLEQAVMQDLCGCERCGRKLTDLFGLPLLASASCECRVEKASDVVGEPATQQISWIAQDRRIVAVPFPQYKGITFICMPASNLCLVQYNAELRAAVQLAVLVHGQSMAIRESV